MKTDFEPQAAFALTIDGESVAMSLDDVLQLTRAAPDSALARAIKSKLTEEELASADFSASLTEEQRKVVGSDSAEAWLPDALVARLSRDPETSAFAELLKIALVAQMFVTVRAGV